MRGILGARQILFSLPSVVLVLLGLVALSTWDARGGAAGGSQQEEGFLALSNEAARLFSLPADTQLVRSFPLEPYGLTYRRYQQRFGPLAAAVRGGQITIYEGADGEQRLVIGAHFPQIDPVNFPALSAGQARGIVEREVGTAERTVTELMINPETGRYFWRVETFRLDSRLVLWVDAEDGRVLNRIDAIMTDHGTGVKTDTKNMGGGRTTFHSVSGHGASGAHWDLFSTDNRQHTFDYRNRDPFVYYASDADNHWTQVTADRASPGQPGLVDAHYYAGVVDQYYLTRHGLDWLADCGYSSMQSVAHFERSYNNAFWNGIYAIYGDGDGISFREFSGALDIVAHEHTHGVIDCTSQLEYQNEPGALNESFSDVLAASTEFFAATLGLDPAASADWTITCARPPSKVSGIWRTRSCAARPCAAPSRTTVPNATRAARTTAASTSTATSRTTRTTCW